MTRSAIIRSLGDVVTRLCTAKKWEFICLLLIVGLTTNQSSGAELDFDRDVLPILSDRCFFCHGPDEASNESGLRLDRRDDALAAIDLASPEKSLLIERITTDDPSLRMPPPESNLSVTQAELSTLRRWIEQGAPYRGHWAFEPLPEQVEIPATADSSWSRQPIDSFVNSRLHERGLEPSPEANRYRWLRRVTFDLTGLPPTTSEIDTFINDDSSDAFERVVDRLLESKRYGEHMAVSWLDAARYADSYGFQSDQLNSIWPYRDWVVDAFNQNLSYDKFVTWQLAGDLLPNANREQQLATAFNRLHRMTNEGGSVFEEWRIENVADRVHTFGTAMLGVTLECARCHDHKYDPISMRDYYSFFAFFNSIDENGLYDQAQKIPSPTMLLPTPSQEQSLHDAKKSLTEAEVKFHKVLEAAQARFETDESVAQLDTNVIPDLVWHQRFDESSPKDTDSTSFGFVTDNGGKASELPTVVVTESPWASIDPTQGERRAIQLDGDRGVAPTAPSTIDRWTPFSVAVTFLQPKRGNTREVIVQHSRGTDAGYNGWDLTIENGFLESRLYRVWPGNAIGIRTQKPLAEGEWHRLIATYDGSFRAAGLKLYLNGEVLDTTILRDEAMKSANVAVAHGGKLVFGQRFRSRGFADALLDDASFYSRELQAEEVRQLSAGQGSVSAGQGSGKSARTLALAFDDATRQAMQELTQARQAVVMAEEAMHEIPVMKDLAEPVEAHILARGQYDAATSEETRVGRDTFEEIQPGFPANAPRDRLGLAQWMTSPEHPLTARVFVNRIWINFFGQGLVRTPENFGRQGERPTHPQLLDWLARDFIDHDWDIKRLCKQIVLSATYRQASTLTPKLAEIDPENRLLARGPAFRLSAEQIRDLALHASGLLSDEQGGAPVSPYQPGGDLWRESNGMSPPYRQSVGKGLYRRSLYSVWKRTAPLPNMMAFDASTREVCSVYRSRTNTPLQALVLLNDIQFVEAARVLAESVYPDATDDEVRISTAFARFASRPPDDFELKTLIELLRDERSFYQEHPEQAQQFLQVGEATVESPIPASDLAAFTIVCQAILNLDATVWKR